MIKWLSFFSEPGKFITGRVSEKDAYFTNRPWAFYTVTIREQNSEYVYRVSKKEFKKINEGAVVRLEYKYYKGWMWAKRA